MTEPAAQEGQQWRVEGEYLVSPEGRVMAEATDRVAVLYDLAARLNSLEQALREARAEAEEWKALAENVFTEGDLDSDEYGMRCHWCSQEQQHNIGTPEQLSDPTAFRAWVDHLPDCLGVRYGRLVAKEGSVH